MRVAWIGMGRIGKQMALRVIQGGHDLIGHARTPEKHDDIGQAGARLTRSVAEAVADAEIVCVNVYSEAQLHEVLFDGGGLAAMQAGAILAVHSTVGPAFVEHIVAARPEIRVLDAAFSGTDANAAAGTIALMIGGAVATLEQARPVLGTYADHIAHLGPNGAGMSLKLLNNSLFGAHMIMARDAMRVIQASGLNKDIAVATLARSSGGSFAINLFSDGADPTQRMASVWPYMEKDIAVSRAAAQEMGLDLGMLATATAPFLKR